MNRQRGPRPEELRERLAARGLDPREVFEPFHYSLHPRPSHQEVRIDLLFPSSAPETLAMMAARPASVEGMTVPVWPLEHIVAAKLLVDPDIDPQRARKDRADLDEMWQRA